jgi:hypothetical protein
MRWPIGSSFGKNLFASRSLITRTGGAPFVSRSERAPAEPPGPAKQRNVSSYFAYRDWSQSYTAVGAFNGSVAVIGAEENGALCRAFGVDLEVHLTVHGNLQLILG